MNFMYLFIQLVYGVSAAGDCVLAFPLGHVVLSSVACTE